MDMNCSHIFHFIRTEYLHDNKNSTMVGNCSSFTESDRTTAHVVGGIGQQTVPEPPLYILICVTLLYAFIFISGILGNALVVFVVLMNKDMKNPTNYFLVNLSIADLLVIIVCMPSAFVDLYGKDVWYLGDAMCKIVPMMENAVALASVLTILAISFERYYAIVYPLKVQYTCTTTRMLKIVVAIWAISLVTCLPFINMAVFKESNLIDGSPITVCRTYIRQVWQKAYLVGLTGVFFVVPFILLLVVYSIISRTLISESLQAKMLSDHTNHNSIKARRQVVIMLFAVVMMFFMCLLPVQTVRLWTLFSSVKDVRSLGLEAYLNIIYFARVMLYLNSAINPFCYSITSTKFRNAFKRAMGIKSRNNTVTFNTYISRGSPQTQLSMTYLENGKVGPHKMESIHMYRGVDYSSRHGPGTRV